MCIGKYYEIVKDVLWIQLCYCTETIEMSLCVCVCSTMQILVFMVPSMLVHSELRYVLNKHFEIGQLLHKLHL